MATNINDFENKMKKTISVLNSEERLILALRAVYEGFGYSKYRMSRFEEYRLYMENKNFLLFFFLSSFSSQYPLHNNHLNAFNNIRHIHIARHKV